MVELKDVKCHYCGAITLNPLVLTRAEFYRDVENLALPDGKMNFCNESCKEKMSQSGWPLIVEETGKRLVEDHEKMFGEDYQP